MNIAILTCRELANLLDYDRDIVAIFSSMEQNASPVVWDSSKDCLRGFDAAIFRTTWNYYLEAERFRSFLDYLDLLNIPVLNPTQLIRSNMHKFYLRELNAKGISIIPTVFADQGSPTNLHEIISAQGWDSFVVKPAVSAGSHSTALFSSEQMPSAQQFLDSVLSRNDALIQQFLPEVQTGELSNIYFANGFQYCVRKTPANGDFRVQYQYGGIYKQCEPSAIVRTEVGKVIELFHDQSLYIRVDGIEREDKFLIMEVEMIEPDLYMNLIPGAKEAFVQSALSKLCL